MLSLIWFRTPDNVEHGYGPGSVNAVAGLCSQDARLGELIAALRANGMDGSTNIIVFSDHGHSSMSGPLALYPLRSITSVGVLPNGSLVNGSTRGSTNSVVGSVAPSGGYSLSGDVLSADLLTYRGFNAYDGTGCSTSALYGLDAAGKPTVPVQNDATGSLCGAANTKYQATAPRSAPRWRASRCRRRVACQPMASSLRPTVARTTSTYPATAPPPSPSCPAR
jgi:hypothetical protein